MKSHGRIEAVGIDEVGKGCIFGPVFAAAVSLNRSTQIKLINAGLKDSKKLTKRKRADLVPLIKEHSQAWALGQSSAKEIDRIGIRAATENAMIRALHKLSFKPNLLLVDGILQIRSWTGKQKTIIHGEDHYPEIAAASVLAKEARDLLIKRLAKKFPNYELITNVGYPTKIHREKLLTEGPSILHRRSFLLKILSKK